MLNYLENKKKSLMQKVKDKKGFTLVELMIVIVIIGILVVMAMANFGKSGEDAKVARAKSDARTLAGAVQIYYSDTGDSTGILKTITAGGGSEQELCQTLMKADVSPATGEKVGPWMSSCPIPPWSNSNYIVKADEKTGQLYVSVTKGGSELFNSKNLAGKAKSGTTTPTTPANP